MLACGYRKGRAETLAVCFAVSAFIFLCDVPRLTDRFRPSLAGSFFLVEIPLPQDKVR